MFSICSELYFRIIFVFTHSKKCIFELLWKEKYSMNRKNVIHCVIVLILLVACDSKESRSTITDTPPKNPLPTEQFIRNHLLQPDGLISTNLTDRKGEYLSESIGLWMEYLLISDQKQSFDFQLSVLRKHFYSKDNLLIWRIDKGQMANANALIDDLRVINVLYRAEKKWGDVQYKEYANKMSKTLLKYQLQQQYFVDFINLDDKQGTHYLTLSYIMPNALRQMKKEGLLSEGVYSQNIDVLRNAPTSKEGLYPKSFNTESSQYVFDQRVNLIDQLYIGYHLASIGEDVNSLVEFIEDRMNNNNGKLFGQYSGRTGTPIVRYESPSVYALAIMFLNETDHQNLIPELYKRMIALRQNSEEKPYFGGYIDVDTLETHAFDNLLPLIVDTLYAKNSQN